jgi:hypothetical protein
MNGTGSSLVYSGCVQVFPKYFKYPV